MDTTVRFEDDIENNSNNSVSNGNSVNNGKWHLFGKVCPKSEIVFFVQIILVYIVVIVSIVNLTIGRVDDDKLWIALLSSSIGYILPCPSLKIVNKQK